MKNRLKYIGLSFLIFFFLNVTIDYIFGHPIDWETNCYISIFASLIGAVFVKDNNNEQQNYEIF